MNRTELQDQIKAALKAHDKVRLATLRAVLTEVKNFEIDTREEADEQKVNELAKRVLKQTRETLEEGPPVSVIVEQLNLVDPAHHHVVYVRFAFHSLSPWHVALLSFGKQTLLRD